MKFKSKCNIFLSAKCVWNYRLQNGGHLVPPCTSGAVHRGPVRPPTHIIALHNGSRPTFFGSWFITLWMRVFTVIELIIFTEEQGVSCLVGRLNEGPATASTLAPIFIIGQNLKRPLLCSTKRIEVFSISDGRWWARRGILESNLRSGVLYNKRLRIVSSYFVVDCRHNGIILM